MRRFSAMMVALALAVLLQAVPNAARANPEPGPVRRAPGAARLIARDGARLGAAMTWLRGDPRRGLYVFFTPDTYVECRPGPARGTIDCLAPCPDAWPWLEKVLTPQRIARLHAAGYADPGVEYSKEYLAGEPADVIAAELIALLHDAYDYRGMPPLILTAEMPPP